MKIKADFDLKPSFMMKIGLRAKRLIKDDAGKGINQNVNRGSTGGYRSESYKKYKANYMKRFTNRRGPKGSYLANTERPVVSNETSFKNYTLSGHMFRDMHVRPKMNEALISFANKDRGKVLGALDNGDVLASLNKVNANTIEKMIVKQITKQVGKWAKEDLIIQIG